MIEMYPPRWTCLVGLNPPSSKWERRAWPEHAAPWTASLSKLSCRGKVTKCVLIFTSCIEQLISKFIDADDWLMSRHHIFTATRFTFSTTRECKYTLFAGEAAVTALLRSSLIWPATQFTCSVRHTLTRLWPQNPPNKSLPQSSV